MLIRKDVNGLLKIDEKCDHLWQSLLTYSPIFCAKCHFLVDEILWKGFMAIEFLFGYLSLGRLVSVQKKLCSVFTILQVSIG